MSIERRPWLEAGLAIGLGVLLVLLSQLGSEALSRAGPYQPDREIVLILPGEEQLAPDDAPRVVPEFTSVPAYVYRDPDKSGPGIFETTFSWQPGDPEPALLLAFFRRLDAIELNGHPVALQNLRNQSLFGGWRPVAVMFEEEQLVPGKNQLRITDPGKSKKVLPAFKVVPAQQALSAAFAGEFFELHLPLAVTGIMVFVALFCGFISWPSNETLQIRCFIVLLLAWSLRNAMGFDLIGDLPNPWRVFAAYWVGYVLAVSFAAYCFAWGEKGVRWVSAASVIGTGAIVLTLALGYESGGDAFQISYLVESWLIPLLVVAGITVAFLHEGKTGTNRPVQLMLIVGSGTALAMDALDERFDISLGLLDPQPMIYYATPRHGLLLALGVLGAMIFHQVRARRLSEDLNGELNRQLDVRQEELAEVHAREKVWVREQALSNERKRIMRDMHDGLGSQIMGMLLAARRGKADPDKVAEGLQQVVDELRLMIDSMDSIGGSLDTALAGFRGRLQPRIEDAGFAFEWENKLGESVPEFAPRKTLQLFRIMQEAVTNALRHSGGSRVAITLEYEGEAGQWLSVTVRDDGIGVLGPRLGGHGLENMRARAAKEGGSVNFGDPTDGNGGVVVIRFPHGEMP
ncbi:MAG: ATP-binding protein [Pseudomonadota bacterium]